jgi:hypothetical protein
MFSQQCTEKKVQYKGGNWLLIGKEGQEGRD